MTTLINVEKAFEKNVAQMHYRILCTCEKENKIMNFERNKKRLYWVNNPDPKRQMLDVFFHMKLLALNAHVGVYILG